MNHVKGGRNNILGISSSVQRTLVLIGAVYLLFAVAGAIIVCISAFFLVRTKVLKNTGHGETDEITVAPDPSRARSVREASTPLGSNSRWGRRKEITPTNQNDFRRRAAQAVLHHHGTRNTVDQTRNRIRRIIWPQQTLIVVTKAHERFYSDLVSDAHCSRVLVQPYNRGTGARDRIQFGAAARIGPKRRRRHVPVGPSFRR